MKQSEATSEIKEVKDECGYVKEIREFYRQKQGKHMRSLADLKHDYVAKISDLTDHNNVHTAILLSVPLRTLRSWLNNTIERSLDTYHCCKCGAYHQVPRREKIEDLRN